MPIHIVFCLAKDREKIVAEKKIIQIQITIYVHIRNVGDVKIMTIISVALMCRVIIVNVDDKGAKHKLESDSE
jgi:hypothetical protein